MVMTTPRIG